jgi:tripartite-type tricarboxylate transporter receptor subunit TctC
MAALGVVPDPMSPEEFKQFIAAETAKWGEVVKFAGIKAQ